MASAPVRSSKTAPSTRFRGLPGAVGADRWRTLSEACRLALIERALMPANDLTDGFPAAL